VYAEKAIELDDIFPDSGNQAGFISGNIWLHSEVEVIPHAINPEYSLKS
jgi:hypothetical protein